MVKYLLSFLLALAVVLACGSALASDAGPTEAPAAEPAAAPTEAPAAEAPAPAAEPTTEPAAVEVAAKPATELDALARAYHAVRAGNYREVAALALILVMMLGRRFEKKLPGFLHGDRGRVILLFILAFAGAAGHTALAGGEFGSLSLWKTAAVVAVEAAGGYTAFRKLVWPKADEPELVPDLEPA